MRGGRDAKCLAYGGNESGGEATDRTERVPVGGAKRFEQCLNLLHFRSSLRYLPVGPGPAIALSHSKLPWESKLPNDWEKVKPMTDFGKLPVLTITDDMKNKLHISHELGILSFVGRQVPEMAGETFLDWSISTQLMGECEDIYWKLTNYQPTTRVSKKCSREEYVALWNSDPDFSIHNRNQGLHCNLALIERFGDKYSRHMDAGKFTSRGNTIGECKLFSTLHALVMIESNILDKYARLGEFYERFGGLEGTKVVTKDTVYNQYFVKG
jgi:hypothetical protein